MLPRVGFNCLNCYDTGVQRCLILTNTFDIQTHMQNESQMIDVPCTSCTTRKSKPTCAEIMQHVLDNVPEEGPVCTKTKARLYVVQQLQNALYRATGSVYYFQCCPEHVGALKAICTGLTRAAQPSMRRRMLDKGGCSPRQPIAAWVKQWKLYNDLLNTWFEIHCKGSVVSSYH